MVGKWQEFDYSLGRLDRTFLIQEQLQVQFLDENILSLIVKDQGEPPPKRFQGIHCATVKCEIRIDFVLLEIGSRSW